MIFRPWAKRPRRSWLVFFWLFPLLLWSFYDFSYFQQNQNANAGKGTLPLLPLHISPQAVSEKPIVQSFTPIYQFDQKYADLFSSKGDSFLCGPIALANIWLNQFYQNPNLQTNVPHFDEDELSRQTQEESYVRTFFDLCQTDPDIGTNIVDLKKCASLALQPEFDPEFDKDQKDQLSLDPKAKAFIQGVHSDLSFLLTPPQPSDLYSNLKNALQSPPHQGIILLFGFYQKQFSKKPNFFGSDKHQDQEQKRWKRSGGHFVNLIGHNDLEKDYLSNLGHKEYIFYIANPQINYRSIKFNSKIPFSKITLKTFPQEILLPKFLKQDVHQIWATKDLVQGSWAILEDMLIIPLNSVI